MEGFFGGKQEKGICPGNVKGTLGFFFNFSTKILEKNNEIYDGSNIVRTNMGNIGKKNAFHSNIKKIISSI